MDQLVSIIVPVYNVEKYISKCLDSLILQTYSNIEIILINDGSKDKSLDICYEYRNRDNRISLIDKKNEGVAIARNTGIKKATGTWLMFVDSDDWLEPNAIEMLIKENNENIDMVMGSYYYNYTDSEKDMTLISNKEEYEVSEYGTEILGSCMINTNYFKTLFHEKFRFGSLLHYPVLKLYRKQVIDNNNLKFPDGIKQNEDKIFNYLFVKYARVIKYIPTPIYHYRIREGMASAADGVVLRGQYTDAIEKWNEIIATENDEKKQELLVFFDLNVLMLTKSLSSALIKGSNNIKTLSHSKRVLKVFVENNIVKKSLSRKQYTKLPKRSTRISIWLILRRFYYTELILSMISEGVKNG